MTILPVTEDDVALLRRFEPVLAFTHGELFFPMTVDGYVAAASLWRSYPDGREEEVVSAEHLTLTTLGRIPPALENTVYYLRLVDPAARDAPRNYLRLLERRDFKVGRGRLARVGLLSRVLDTLFSVTLLMRGRVPGGTAAIAREFYREHTARDAQPAYYGRVLRRDGYIVLQYWFFYCMNDWRTGYNGVNDHEADWEQVTIFCEDDVGEVQPRWLALASHDSSGADLRRRWDDPTLTLHGNHPVVYIAAGSHAAYFEAGEYMHNVTVPFSSVFSRVWGPLTGTVSRVFRLGSPEAESESVPGALSIPFVDYARGDGWRIGPNQPDGWHAVPVPFSVGRDEDAEFAWAEEYRGLWGLYARDPVAGENAPAGMKFNRDGTVRHAWYDPLGWAGLEMVPATRSTLALIAAQISAIHQRSADLETRDSDLRRQLQGLHLELEAMAGQPHFKVEIADRQQQILNLSNELKSVGLQLTQNRTLIESLSDLADRQHAGLQSTPDAHLSHAVHHPLNEEALRLGTLAEAWAALSVGVLLVAFVLVMVFAPRFWLTSLAAMLGVATFVEALFQKQARLLIRRVALALTFLALGVLIYEFAWPLLILAVLALGLFILFENFTELIGR